jgi:tetratricopeptide (TPR) repeat protein
MRDLNEVIFESLHLRTAGDPRAASERLSLAIAADPLRGDLWHYLSLALLDCGEMTPAIAAVKRAVALGESEVSHVLLTDLLIKTGALEEALSELEMVLSAHPDSARARSLKATILGYQKNWKAAADCLEKAIASSPHFVNAYLELAHAYSQDLLFADAENALQRLTNCCPRYLAGHIELAKFLKTQGRTADEKSAWINAAHHVANAHPNEQRIQEADKLNAEINFNLKRLMLWRS